MKKILFIAILIMLSISAVYASENTTLTDDNPLSESPITDTLGDGETKDISEIQSEIDNAHEAEEIEVEGIFCDRADSLKIKKSISINGNGKTRFDDLRYEIGDVNVTFKNLYLNYARIQCSNSNLCLINCNLTELIINDNCNLKLMNCSIESPSINLKLRNLTVSNTIFTQSAYITINCNCLTLDNCIFNESSFSFLNKRTILRNSIFNGDSYGHIEFQESSINDIEGCILNSIRIYSDKSRTNINRTALNCVLTSGEDFRISNSRMDGCELSSDDLTVDNCSLDATVFRHRANLIMKDSNVSHISTSLWSINGVNTTIDIDGCTFSDNALGDFFIISGDEGICRIKNSNFIKNTMAENLIQSNTMSHSAVYIDNCTFIKNVAGDDLIDTASHDMDLKVENSLFQENACKNVLLISKFLSINDVTNDTVRGNLFSNNKCTYAICWVIQTWEHMELMKNIGKSNFTINLENNIFECNLNSANSPANVKLNPPMKDSSATPSIFANLNIKNNFFNRNYENENGAGIFDNIKGEYETAKYATIDLVNGTLQFVDIKGNPVRMHDYTISIKNRTTGNVIHSDVTLKEGRAILPSSALNLDEVYLTNRFLQNINNPSAQISLTQVGSNYEDFKIICTIKNGNEEITAKTIKVEMDGITANGETYHSSFFRTNSIFSQYTTKEIMADENVLPAYDYREINVSVYFANEKFGLSQAHLSKIRLSQIEAYTKTSKVVATYNAINTAQIMLYYKNTTAPLNPISDNYGGLQDFSIEIYKNSKKVGKTYYVRHENGKLTFKIPKLDAGNYKMVIFTAAKSAYNLPKKTISLTVSKIKTTVKAPKVTFKAKQSKYFKVTVKANGKAIKNLKLKVKIAKKTYTIKTNSKGIAQLNTKSLKAGTYKVSITSGNPNYNVNAKSTIKIKR